MQGLLRLLSLAVPGVDLGECVISSGLVGPAPLVEAGMITSTPLYRRLEVFPCDFAGPAGSFGSSTSPLRLRGIVEEYSQT